jgi:hypothetical protein
MRLQNTRRQHKLRQQIAMQQNTRQQKMCRPHRKEGILMNKIDGDSAPRRICLCDSETSY